MNRQHDTLFSKSRQALGFIETRGYLPAIAAADASLKSADVELLGLERTKGGLVTVIVTGDVSAVQAAVDAGAELARQKHGLVSHNTIARPVDDLMSAMSRVLPVEETTEASEGVALEANKSEKSDEIVTNINNPETASPDNPLSESISESISVISNENDEDSINESLSPHVQSVTAEHLKSYSVMSLRKMARQIKDFSLSRNEIKSAKKIDLINALIDSNQLER